LKSNRNNELAHEFTIKSKGNTKGNWIEVDVIEYNRSECLESENEVIELNHYNGWLKAIDETTGIPNLWIYKCCSLD
jgi:hypothetical protein